MTNATQTIMIDNAKLEKLSNPNERTLSPIFGSKDYSEQCATHQMLNSAINYVKANFTRAESAQMKEFKLDQFAKFIAKAEKLATFEEVNMPIVITQAMYNGLDYMQVSSVGGVSMSTDEKRSKLVERWTLLNAAKFAAMLVDVKKISNEIVDELAAVHLKEKGNDSLFLVTINNKVYPFVADSIQSAIESVAK